MNSDPRARESSPYVGRFAPSPTGPLHFGSLIAAVASFLEARTRHGRWLLRIEDLDPPREIPGAASGIVRTLERLGFEWDGPVVFQSHRTSLYEAALDTLAQRGHTYACICSRKQIRAAAEHLKGESPGYPGTCRARVVDSSVPRAIRVLTDATAVVFEDRLQGRHVATLETSGGDFVLLRRDGLVAYQLAVVVDDELQGITEVVRGTDLLTSTPRQIYLQQLLGYRHPCYRHIPVAVDAGGVKLSKRTGAAAVDELSPDAALLGALDFLRQAPPDELIGAPNELIWSWAVENWRSEGLRGHRQLPVAADPAA